MKKGDHLKRRFLFFLALLMILTLTLPALAGAETELDLTVPGLRIGVAACHSGKADVISANLQVTPERAEALRFSDPLFRLESGIVVRKTGTDAASEAAPDVHWQDYNGRRIGVLVGPLMEDAAHTYLPDSEYLLFNSYPDCVAYRQRAFAENAGGHGGGNQLQL